MKKWEQEGIIVKSRTSFSDALYLEKLKSSKLGISQKKLAAESGFYNDYEEEASEQKYKQV